MFALGDYRERCYNIFYCNFANRFYNVSITTKNNKVLFQIVNRENKNIIIRAEKPLNKEKLYTPLFTNFENFLNQSFKLAKDSIKNKLLALKSQVKNIEYADEVIDDYIEDVPYKMDKISDKKFINNKLVYEWSTGWADVEISYGVNLRPNLRINLDPNMINYITKRAKATQKEYNRKPASVDYYRINNTLKKIGIVPTKTLVDFIEEYNNSNPRNMYYKNYKVNYVSNFKYEIKSVYGQDVSKKDYKKGFIFKRLDNNAYNQARQESINKYIKGVDEEGILLLSLDKIGDIFLKKDGIYDINDNKLAPNFDAFYKNIRIGDNFSNINKHNGLKQKLTPIIRVYLTKKVKENNLDIGCGLLNDHPDFQKYLNDMTTKGYIEDISKDSYGYEVSWITPSIERELGWWHEIELDKNLKPTRAYLQT